MKFHLVHKIICLFVMTTLLFIHPESAQLVKADRLVQLESAKLSVYLDGYPLEFSVEPRIVTEESGGHTVVPFRGLAEALGVNVEWENATQTVVASGYGKEIRLPVGSKEALVDNVDYTLEVAPFIDQGHTLIPLRFFSEVFGAEVNWNSENQRIDIQSPRRDMYTFSFYGLGSFEHRDYVPYFDGIAYTWSRINQQGELVTANRDNGQYNEFFWPAPHPDASPEEIIKSGQQNNGQAFLMVAAFESRGEVSALLLNPEKREKAITDMLQLATEKGLDGLLLDIEGISRLAEHEALSLAYTDFVQQLASTAKERNVQIGIALPPPNNFYNGYDYQQLGGLADFIFLMAYDYNPRGENQAHWLPEPMVAVNEGIKLTLEHIAKEKIILGINLLYETPETTVEKMGLAKRYGLKGVGFWLLKELNEENLSLINKSIPLNN